MVQGLPKGGGRKKEKKSLKHRRKPDGRPSKEGVIKTAKKPRGNMEQTRQQLKMKKKLTGAIGSHIEQLMMNRVQEDRGMTAPSQLKVLRKDPNFDDGSKKNKHGGAGGAGGKSKRAKGGAKGGNRKSGKK